MAKAPIGPIAATRALLEKRREDIYEKRLKRPQVIAMLVSKGYNEATIKSTVGVWMRSQGMSFSGVSPAMLRKIAAHKKVKAARERAAPN